MVIVIVIVIGLVVGSFLNAVIFRLKSGESVLTGRSHCLTCEHPLSARDLVPVLSFIWLSGKCRYCKTKLSWQYPAVELLTALCFVLLAYNLPACNALACEAGRQPTTYNLIQAVFICFLIVIAVYDLKRYLILDKIVFPAFIFALAVSIYQGRLISSLSAVAVVSGFFLLQYAVSRGRWIGFGDVKFGLFLGSMAGLALVVPLLLLAYFSGAIVGLSLIAAGKKQLSSRLPFGVFLGFSGIIVVLYGQEILSWYSSLIGL